jgi:hypothetical protein
LVPPSRAVASAKEAELPDKSRALQLAELIKSVVQFPNELAYGEVQRDLIDGANLLAELVDLAHSQAAELARIAKPERSEATNVPTPTPSEVR